MSQRTEELKAGLRRDIRARLEAMSPAERASASEQLRARLLDQPQFRAARSILCFAPTPDEPDIFPVIDHCLATGKEVALPGFDAAAGAYEARQIAATQRDLSAGRFGIIEPASHCPLFPLNRLDFVLVPGVAFDFGGGRIGRGKGFYDRLLARVPGFKCGVGFDCQLVAGVPLEPHDVRLNCILTPTRWQPVPGRRTDLE